MASESVDIYLFGLVLPDLQVIQEVQDSPGRLLRLLVPSYLLYPKIMSIRLLMTFKIEIHIEKLWLEM